MKKILIPLTAAFGLTMSALAQIPIKYLPYTISAPGSYYLATDLTAIPNSVAITVKQPIGDVLLDLKGHTLHLRGNTSYGIVANMSGGAAGGVTIQNGTLSVSAYGLEVTNNISPNKNTDLIVQNVTFSNNSTSAEDIYLSQANYAQIKSCKFVGAGRIGILDENSPTGNVFTNLYFDGKLSVNIMEENGNRSDPVILNYSSEIAF